MPSAAAKARKQNKKHQDKNRQRKTQGLTETTEAEVAAKEQAVIDASKGTAEEQALEKSRLEAEQKVKENLENQATDIEKLRAEQDEINRNARNVTGVCGTRELTSSVHINGMSITYYGQV